MRFPRFACVGVFSAIAAVPVACSSTTEVTMTGGTTGGPGGGESTTASTTASVTTGTGGTGTGGSDNGHPSTSYPAPHPSPPTVINYGGPVMTAPVIYPVYFSGDDTTLTDQVTEFINTVGATQYWTAVTAEYGVGPAKLGNVIQLTEAAPATLTDDDIQTWLAGKLNADDPAFPMVDGNTLITLQYPKGTVISLGGGGNVSCQSFGGYHSDFQLDAAHGNREVAYAVIPRCDDFDMMTGIDAVTATLSHEIIEAVTDPYPMSNTPTYAMVDDQDLYWSRVLGGGETGDMCAQFDNAFTKFAELPKFVVQRSWSNKAAKAGHDPCQPGLPGAVYFNSAPVLPDQVSYSYFGQMVKVRGVKIALGESRTIDLDLFSDGDTGGPWKVEVEDFSALMGQPAKLSFDLDRDTGVNGEKLHLTITVNTEGKNKTETFIVHSLLGGQKNIWVGLVGSM
jgi:hypothetical protein